MHGLMSIKATGPNCEHTISKFVHPRQCDTGRSTLIMSIGLHIARSDLTVICGHDTISMLWGNTAYCVKISDEDLTRYSNETEPVLFYENVAWYLST